MFNLEIRALSPSAYKSGQWGKIIATGTFGGRRVYAVEWSDKALDFWPVTDPDAGYEFRPIIKD